MKYIYDEIDAYWPEYIHMLVISISITWSTASTTLVIDLSGKYVTTNTVFNLGIHWSEN